LIERACFELISAVSRSPTIFCGSYWRFNLRFHDPLGREGQHLARESSRR